MTVVPETGVPVEVVPQQEVEAADNGVGGNGPSAVPGADDQLVPGRQTSDVWVDFIKVWYKGEVKAQCKHCKKHLVGHSNNGTSHLKNHSSTCIQKKIQDGSLKMIGPNWNVKGKKEMSSINFKSEVSRQELAMAVVMHEYPLSMVEHLYFKRFVTSLQPLFHVPCRNTMKKEILKLYEHERMKIQRIIDRNLGKVVVTTDLWTASNQKKGYMAITGHYIDNNWTLRSHLLRFVICSKVFVLLSIGFRFLMDLVFVCWIS